MIEFLKFIYTKGAEANKNILIDDNSSCTLSVNELKRNILFFGFYLKKIGINTGDKICLFAENHPNYVAFELAILKINAVCVPRGSINPISELDYIYKDSDASGIITDNVKIVEYFISNRNSYNSLEFIIYFGNEEHLLIQDSKILKYSDFDLSQKIEEFDLSSESIDNKLAFILYTSGTSGFPKGAMINSASINYQIKALSNRIKADAGKTFLCLHPLWHSGPRIYNLFFIQSSCNVIYTSFKNYILSIKKYSPEYLHAVPKAIYAIYDEYISILSKTNIFYQLIFKTLFFLSLKYKKALRLTKKQNSILPPPKLLDYIEAYILCFLLHFVHILANEIFYKDFRRKLLKDDLIIFTGAAKLSNYILDLFDVIDVKIIVGYGLTETSPLLTHDNLDEHKYYSAGFPLINTEIKIVNPETFEDLNKNELGMIVAKGPQVMKGYYNRDEDTRKTFLGDGYLKTGDLGWLSDYNHLTVTSRWDDTIVLSNGLNIDTLYIEEECIKSPFLEQIVLIGNGKPHISALCNLRKIEYINWCIKNKIKEISPNKNIKFKNYFMLHLNEIISKRKNFVPYEKIKNVYFTSEQFSIENGFITNTSKLKRMEISNFFNKQIDRIYNGNNL